jgi:hypothetical protein
MGNRTSPTRHGSGLKGFLRRNRTGHFIPLIDPADTGGGGGGGANVLQLDGDNLQLGGEDLTLGE